MRYYRMFCQKQFFLLDLCRCHKQALSSSLRYTRVSCSFEFFGYFFFSKNGPQALYINLDCLRYISSVNFSPANKNWLIVAIVVSRVREFWFLIALSQQSDRFLLQGKSWFFGVPHRTMWKDHFISFSSFSCLGFYFLYFFCFSSKMIASPYN